MNHEDDNDIVPSPSPPFQFVYPPIAPPPNITHPYSGAGMMGPANFYNSPPAPFMYQNPWMQFPRQFSGSFTMSWWCIAVLTGLLAFLILIHATPTWLQHHCQDETTSARQSDVFHPQPKPQPNITRIAMVSATISFLVLIISFISLQCIRGNQEHMRNQHHPVHMYPQQQHSQMF